MKFNDVVLYSESCDKEGNPIFVNALVIGERDINENFLNDDGKREIASHRGKNGEPLLSLVFGKQRLDSAGLPLPVHGTGHTGELAQVRVDVAHESHEYTSAQQRSFGKRRYDGGRWREVPSAPVPAVEPPITAESLGLADDGDKKE